MSTYSSSANRSTEGIFRPKATDKEVSTVHETKVSSSEHRPTTEKQGVPSALNQSKLLAEEQWNKAYEMLESNPNLMTSNILCMALKRNAPIYLIRFMLQLNPKAAEVPKLGPSPLQIAVQSSCSVDVVREVLVRCPLALSATNPGSRLEPLAYAKIHRSSETDLIKLLNLPVSRWVKGNVVSGEDDLYSRNCDAPPGHQKQEPTKVAVAQRMKPVLSFLPYTYCGANNEMVSASPERSDGSRQDTSMSSRSEDMDLDNVKLICMSVLKGHKRLARDISKVQKKVSALSGSSRDFLGFPKMPDVAQLLESHTKSLVSKVREQQEEFAHVQMMAWDTKERAMRSHVRRMEQRMMSSILSSKEDTDARVDQRFDSLVQEVQSRLLQFSHRLDSVDALAQEPVAKYTPRRSREETMMQTAMHKVVDDGKREAKRGGGSPHTISTASQSWSSLNSSFDTCFSSIDTWGFPVNFLSNAEENDDSDEVRSLLTEGDLLERPSLQAHQKRALARGKRLANAMCKSSRLMKHEI